MNQIVDQSQKIIKNDFELYQTDRNLSDINFSKVTQHLVYYGSKMVQKDKNSVKSESKPVPIDSKFNSKWYKITQKLSRQKHFQHGSKRVQNNINFLKEPIQNESNSVQKWF